MIRRACAVDVARMLASGELSIEDYVGSVYDSIKQWEEQVNAYITVREAEEVVEEARRATSRAGAPLAGVLVAVKDNISTKGLRTTAGSRILEHYVPPYDATVVEKLRDSGAVVIGKTNMDEFAMGSTGENSAYGATRNPWDLSRVPGGSSSGTAAALAAGMATLGLGSDTGGSIRLPASWTGVYGLKPTYGLVSRYGLIAYADSLDQIGPMARCVEDVAVLLGVIGGYDERDSTSLSGDEALQGLVEAATSKPRGVVGVVEEFLDSPSVDVEARAAVEKAAEILERNGVRVDYARLGESVVEYALPAYYVIAMAEASSNLSRYDCVRYGCREKPRPWESWNAYYTRVRSKLLGREVKKRIMLGSWLLSAGYRDKYYVRALKIRRLVEEEVGKALKDRLALLLPSATTLPPRIGEMIEDPGRMYMLDMATVIANLAGVPALSAPVHTVAGLPMGAQFMGKPLSEPILLGLGAVLEEETGFRARTGL